MNFKNILNKLTYQFRDSYGFDKLSKYLIIIGVILTTGKYIAIFGYIIVIYGLWRSISKNKYRRHQELAVFENYLSILKQWFYRTKASMMDNRKYKVFKCPNCSQKLRVPRKRGKIIITCKRCGTEFKGRS